MHDQWDVFFGLYIATDSYHHPEGYTLIILGPRHSFQKMIYMFIVFTKDNTIWLLFLEYEFEMCPLLCY
jgi:hypothetical protein